MAQLYTLGVIMRTRLFITLLLLMPLVLRANPVQIDGESAIAFGIVAFWALVIESALVTLVLITRGLLIGPSFVCLISANIAVFIFAFLPLSGRVSLCFLEPGVVVVDSIAIKLVTAAPFLQGESYVGVSWRRSFIASLLGNAASFFVGVLASGAPWIAHDGGGFE